MSDKALSHEESAVRLLESAENFKLRQQQMALNSAQRSETLKRTQLLNEQLETTMEGRAQIKMEQDAQTEAYNAGVRAIGGRELSTPQVLEKLKNDKTGYQGNFVRYGQDILANGGSKAGIPVLGMGMTAADMMGMVRASSARPTGIDRDVYEFGATETNKAIETLKNALDKDPVKRALQIKEEIYKSASAQLASIDNSTGATNIYSAPTPKQLSEAVPVLNKYPKLQEIIKRSTDNPNVPIKDMDIFEAMKTELQTNPTKENFAEIATSINHYYSAVREYNNTHKGYLEKGLPQQKTYNVALPTGLFGGKQDIDMTDPLQVKRLLIKMSLNMQSSFAPN